MSQSDSASTLIVNSDDFGYCSERNFGIVKCFVEGVVTSATLLVNRASSTVEAVALASKYNIPLGLHLNLTEGAPLSDPRLIETLLDGSGMFLGKLGFRKALSSEAVDPGHIEMELRAQLNWFRTHVPSAITHVDGHNHVHVLPTVAEVLVRVLPDYGISKIRIPYEDQLLATCPWLTDEQASFLTQVCADSQVSRKIFSRQSVLSSSHFVGLGLMGENNTVQNLTRCLSGLPQGSLIEWMVHPGFMQQIERECIADTFSRSKERELEMQTLCSQKLLLYLRQANIKLASWKDVGNV